MAVRHNYDADIDRSRLSNSLKEELRLIFRKHIHIPIWGPGSNGTANRLKRPASPVAVSPIHAGVAFREAVAVVRLAGDVAQQLVHALVEVVITAVGHLQLVLAAR